MPTWMQVVLIAVVVAAVSGGFATLVGRFCGLNDRGEMRAGSRIADRALLIGSPDGHLEAGRRAYYDEQDAMARARARGDSNVVERRPDCSTRGGRAA